MSKRSLFCAGLLLAGLVTQTALGADCPTCCKKLEAKLEKPVCLNFSDTPLRKVIDDLRTMHGLNIEPDYYALQQANISLDRPVSATLEGVSLKSALNVLTRQADLSWTIRENVLFVTTKEHAKGKLVRQTYQVADLVTPITTSNEGGTGTPGVAGIQSSPTPGWTLKKTPVTVKPREANTTSEDQLIKLITSTISPQSWAHNGGPGTIDFFPLGGVLVINQTPDVQEQVAEMLKALRRFQEQTVATEVRFVTISEEMFQRLAREFGLKGGRPNGKDGCVGRERVTFLDHARMHKLMEAAQGDCRTNVMQAPRVTAFNGQEVPLQVCNTEKYVTGVDARWDGDKVVYLPRDEAYTTGIKIAFRPVVSADRRYVRMHFKVELSALQTTPVPLYPIATVLHPITDGNRKLNPVLFTQFIQTPKITKVTADETAVIADGKTMVLDLGSRVREVRPARCAPPLGALPLASDVFATAFDIAGIKTLTAAAKMFDAYADAAQAPCRETEHLLVMVTPKIIGAEKEEVAAPPKCRPAGGAEASEPACASPKVAKLMKQYHKACAAGNVEKARKLIIELIAIDPTCFGKSGKANEEKFDDLCPSSFRSVIPPPPVKYERIHGGIK